MKDFFLVNGLVIWVFIGIFVLASASAIVYYNFVYPQVLAGQRNVDIQSRQNVVGLQTAMRQDMQDAQRNSNNPALVQQDVYDMERLRDQLPDQSFVPLDISQFLASHGG